MENSSLRQKAQTLRQATPPKQQQQEWNEGQLLRAIPRGDREEVRISWAEFQGHPFLNIRLWSRSSDGFKPTQKGFTFKIRELADLAEAVEEAMDLALEYQQTRRPGHGQ